MKKSVIVIAVVLGLVAVLGVAGLAYAQTQPETPFGNMMGGRGRSGQMGGMMGQTGTQSPLHAYMINAFADGLGINAEDLQARIDSGETMYDIATAQGLSTEEITALMLSARTQAFEQAVADGVITAEQAEWMNSRMQQMHNFDGTGDCHSDGARTPRGGRGMMGRGA